MPFTSKIYQSLLNEEELMQVKTVYSLCCQLLGGDQAQWRLRRYSHSTFYEHMKIVAKYLNWLPSELTKSQSCSNDKRELMNSLTEFCFIEGATLNARDIRFRAEANAKYSFLVN